MKIIVFGASGKVGRLLVKELAHGHHKVTAVVYRERNMDFPAGVKVLQLDVHDGLLVHEAIKHNDIVMSALGSWGSGDKDILSSAMENIIPAMRKENIKRIISLTGADARFEEDKPPLSSKLVRPILKMVAGKILRDGEIHLKMLAKSNLRWTVIRSPIMKDGAACNHKLNNRGCAPWEKTTRQTVVKTMVDEIENDQHVRSSPILHAA